MPGKKITNMNWKLKRNPNYFMFVIRYATKNSWDQIISQSTWKYTKRKLLMKKAKIKAMPKLARLIIKKMWLKRKRIDQLWYRLVMSAWNDVRRSLLYTLWLCSNPGIFFAQTSKRFYCLFVLGVESDRAYEPERTCGRFEPEIHHWRWEAYDVILLMNLHVLCALPWFSNVQKTFITQNAP